MSILSKLRGPRAAVTDPVTDIRMAEIEQIRHANGGPEMDADGNDPMSRTVYARIVDRPHGFGYEICVGGVPAIMQDFHPDKEGDAPMTEDEAKAAADKALSEYGRA